MCIYMYGPSHQSVRLFWCSDVLRIEFQLSKSPTAPPRSYRNPSTASRHRATTPHEGVTYSSSEAWLTKCGVCWLARASTQSRLQFFTIANVEHAIPAGVRNLKIPTSVIRQPRELVVDALPDRLPREPPWCFAQSRPRIWPMCSSPCRPSRARRRRSGRCFPPLPTPPGSCMSSTRGESTG